MLTMWRLLVGKWLKPSEAMKLGILDQAEGVYRNPRTGKTTPLHEAIDQGDVKVELGECTYRFTLWYLREFKAVSGPAHATIYIFVWIYECVYTGAKTGFERMRVAFARYR